jgi:hypothetical protein
MRKRGIGQWQRHRTGGCGGSTNGDNIEEAATSFLEVSNRVHITGSIGFVAIYSAVQLRKLQLRTVVELRNPIQLFDFVSDLFDPRSQFSASPTCST